MDRGLLARLQASGLNTIIINATSLVGTTIVTGGLGSAYWWLAARSFAPAALGSASAAVAATTLLATLSILGTGTLIIGELAGRSPVERCRLIVTALAISSIAGAVLGAAYAIVAPHVSTDLQVFGEGPAAVLLFALSVCVFAAAQVVDNALIGLLRGQVQFWRNVLASVAKLLILLIATRLPFLNGVIAVFASVVLGTLVSFASVAHLPGFGRLPWIAYRPQWFLLRRLGRSALEHHILNLSLQVPGLVMPLLVTALLSATANAYFFVALMFATFVALVPSALCTVLYAAGSQDRNTFAAKMRLTFGLSVAATLAANLALVVAGEPLLSLFGRNYAEQVLVVLRLLVVGVFPGIVKTHFVAVCQTHRQVRRAAVINVIGAIVELSAAAEGARLGGLNGLVIGYIATLCVEAVVMAPTVIRALMGTHGRAAATSPVR